MKKSLIFALTALLAVSFTFFSCNPNPEEQKDNNTEQTGGEDPDNSGSGSEAGGGTDKPSTDNPKEDVKPVENKTIFSTAQTESGNVNFNIKATDFETYLNTYDTISFTLKNSSEEDRSGWGVIAFISAETSGSYTWHNLKSNTALGTNEYGQLAIKSFKSGDEATIDVDLQKLATAVAAEGQTNQLALQTSNGAILETIVLSKKN